MTDRSKDWEGLMEYGDVVGASVTMRNPTGLDMITAIGRTATHPDHYIGAVLSQICLFDGKQLNVQQVLGLDHRDYFKLMNEYLLRYGIKK